MNYVRSDLILGRLPLIVLAVLVCFNVPAATYTTPRALNVGDIYELRRDGWVNQSPSGYDGDVSPKMDANAGTGGDNPYFRRHNVARAWPTDTGYWFTGSDQHEGEPDPAGEQWVDYAPPVEILGPGLYSIAASYRWSTNRASYPVIYRVHHALGTNEVLRDQRVGTAAASIVFFNLGEFELRPGSFVRVEDPGAESVTFGNMRFRLIAPVPRLQVMLNAGVCLLRWPTNASAYRLECASAVDGSATWFPVFDAPVTVGDSLTVSLPVMDERKYFRLVKP